MNIIFAGGGTGGHINPAISIADFMRLRHHDFKALFIGTRRGLETRLVPQAGYDIEYIDIRGFDRRNPFNNISVIKKLIKAKSDCAEIIKRFEADAVVCTGGYVSGPVAMAASKLSVPALIHEQNVYPGLTVKGAAKYVEYVAVSFDETVSHIKQKEKCVVTGNPIREEILKANRAECRNKLGIKDNEKFVLIFGGSLGAERINNAVVGILERFSGTNIKILFGTGERNYEDVLKRCSNVGQGITITPYINNMAEVLSASDLVVSRSGAITVSELACLNKPAILIPSPNVVRNHQQQNAKEFEDAGAAVMLCEDDLSSDSLYSALISLINDAGKLECMSENMKKYARSDALLKFEELIIEMCKKGKQK